MDVAGEAETELHGHGRAVAHAVDGEAEQRHARLPRGDERLHGGLIDVVLELVRCDLDGHDLLHALDVDGVDERGGITSDHRNRDRPEPAPGRDQLSGHVPDLAPDVLGNDENAHASRSLTIAAIRPAISAGLPSIISAPSPPVRYEHPSHDVGGHTAVRGAANVDLHLLGLLDRPQVGVAGLVDAGLDRQQRGRVHLDAVHQAALELAVDNRLSGVRVVIDARDDRGARQVEQLGKRCAGRRLHRVAGLNAAEDELRSSACDHVGERPRDREWVRPACLDPDRAGRPPWRGSAATPLGLLCATVTTTTSPPRRSRNRSASSVAKPSHSFSAGST